MAIKNKEKREEGLCGLGSCTPKCLQVFANIKSFGVFYGFNFLITISVGIFLSSQITSIEKQFNFSSAESGIISSANDVGFVLTVLIFSFYGRRSHIPIILGISSILFGASGIIAAIPYFLFPVEDIPQVLNSSGISLGNEAICTSNIALNNSSSTGSASKELLKPKETSNQAALLIICLGMILQGIGKAPRTSLANTYIDDSLEKTKVGLFMGLIIGIGIFGPAIAFILGAQFSSMYVNLKKTDISPHDSRWIGAWWLGFLIFGVLAFISSVPIFFFPKRLKNRRVTLEQAKHNSNVKYIKEFLSLSWNLTKKPLYLLLNLKTLIIIFVMAGSFPFAAKYMEVQYQIPAWKSNMLIGAFSIFIAAFGTVLGGFLTYKYKMTPMACLKFTMLINLISCVFPVLIYMLGCEQPVILKPGDISDLFASSTSNCSKSCYCSDDMFQPVCGADGNTFYSPCHAGCTGMFNGSYTGCSCIPNLNLTQTATPGYCPTKCTNLWPAVYSNLISAFLVCLTFMPDYILLLRSVTEEEKPFALGVQSFLISLLGFIPGPIFFGKLIDSACLKSASQGTGMCLIYDLHDFRLKMSVSRFIASIAIFLTFGAIYYIARKRDDWHTNSDHPAMRFNREEEKAFIVKNGEAEKRARKV